MTDLESALWFAAKPYQRWRNRQHGLSDNLSLWKSLASLPRSGEYFALDCCGYAHRTDLHPVACYAKAWQEVPAQ